MVLEKTLESPLDCKEVQPAHPKGNQSWVLIVRTDAEAENPILWPCDVKSQLIGKDPDAGKDWGQVKRKGWQRMRWLGGITYSMDMHLSRVREIVKDRGAWCAAGHEAANSQTWLSDWTATTTKALWFNTQHFLISIFNTTSTSNNWHLIFLLFSLHLFLRFPFIYGTWWLAFCFWQCCDVSFTKE